MRAELGPLRERLGALGPRELGMPIATMLDGGLPAEGVASFVTADQWREIADAIFAPAADRDR